MIEIKSVSIDKEKLYNLFIEHDSYVKYDYDRKKTIDPLYIGLQSKELGFDVIEVDVEFKIDRDYEFKNNRYYKSINLSLLNVKAFIDGEPITVDNESDVFDYFSTHINSCE